MSAGATPGSTSGASRSIFEEGIRIPVIRIARGGEIDEDLLELIACNTRDPEERLLDLRTQIGTNLRGGAMLLQLDRPHGLAGGRSRRSRTSSPIRAAACATASPRCPTANTASSARWTTTAFRASRCRSSARRASPATRSNFDFAGSGPEARGAINLPDSALKASVYYCVKAVLDPGLMPNQGIIDPITITRARGHHRQSRAARARWRRAP